MPWGATEATRCSSISASRGNLALRMQRINVTLPRSGFRKGSYEVRSWPHCGLAQVDSLAAGKGNPAVPSRHRSQIASYAIGSATGQGHRFRVLRPRTIGGLDASFVALDTELNRAVALRRLGQARA